jgi:NADH-quinone oxidoreductase subunit G
MAKIVIDGETYEVDPANNLLQECLSQGLDLPYFCWHPCMGSIGACRQCAVKQYRNAEDEKGMLVMACMTQATDGMIISIEDEQAKTMRARVIESLMISHPHDCPVCEEGGECHLQDMTLMSGHNYRRYDKKKVTHHNQYLGPFINHEMNRCITCYRCVRFYDDYAGGTDLAAQASHHHTYFGRHEEGVLESEFSGNLVEVCPTGVFTDKVFSEHYSRKWDLQTAPSICVGCAVGCNTTPGERYSSLRRIVNRYNSEVNGYFLCDRGRFGFEFVNSPERLKTPQQTVNGAVTELATEAARALVHEYQKASAIGIGSPRASNESNFALRNLVGEANFYAGVADEEFECLQVQMSLLQDPVFHAPSIREIEQADAVLIVNEDVTNTAPRIALALRQSVRNKAKQLAHDCKIPQWQDAAVRELAQRELSPLCLFGNYATRLDDVASDRLIAANEELIAVLAGVAQAIDTGAPTQAVPTSRSELVQRVSAQLKDARRPLIVTGSNAGVEVLRAAANVARALHAVRKQAIDLCVLAPEVNSVGLAMMTPAGNGLGAALQRLTAGEATHAIVLENDLYRRASQTQVDTALDNVSRLLVIDQLPTATTAKADVLLPATSFSEHEATYVNYEGRAQLSFQVHRSHSQALPGWRWLVTQPDLAVNALIQSCAESAPGFARLSEVLPDESVFVAGMKVPRQSHRYSGRTAMKSNLNVNEPKQPVDTDSILAFSMEGIPSQKNASVLGAAWAPQWNSNQAISKFQDEINGELKQGSVGTHLVQKSASTGAYFPLVTKTSASAAGTLRVAIAHQIFGSDELSARSPTIRQRMTPAYAGIAPSDAEALGLHAGDRVYLGDTGATAIVSLRRHMATGTVAVYCGDEVDRHALPTALVLRKSEAASGPGFSGLIVSDRYEEEL